MFSSMFSSISRQKKIWVNLEVSKRNIKGPKKLRNKRFLQDKQTFAPLTFQIFQIFADSGDFADFFKMFNVAENSLKSQIFI